MISLTTPLPESTLPYNPPRFQCLQKTHLPDGVSFRDWVQNPENIYISYNLCKYSGNSSATDEWNNPELSYLYKCGIISLYGYLRLYELWLRRERWSTLETISGKSLGCWCDHQDHCVFSVIAKVHYEKMFLNSKVVDSVEKVCDGSD